MTGELPIIIPSHKRAGNIPALRAIAKAILCVPESQKGEYERAHPEAPIVTHPDSVIGLPLKRQWIYEKYGDVAMLDDDIEGIIRLYDPPSYLDPGVAWELVQTMADTTRQLGAFLFGFSAQASPRSYNSLKPFRLTGRIRGSFIGLLAGSKLFWTANVSGLIEDTYLSCLNAYYHRYGFFDNRFGTVQKRTMATRGGLAEFRTVEAHKDGALWLQKMFGSEIIHMGKSPSKIAKGEHPYQVSVHFPF